MQGLANSVAYQCMMFQVHFQNNDGWLLVYVGNPSLIMLGFSRKRLFWTEYTIYLYYLMLKFLFLLTWIIGIFHQHIFLNLAPDHHRNWVSFSMKQWAKEHMYVIVWWIIYISGCSYTSIFSLEKNKKIFFFSK